MTGTGPTICVKSLECGTDTKRDEMSDFIMKKALVFYDNDADVFRVTCNAI